MNFSNLLYKIIYNVLIKKKNKWNIEFVVAITITVQLLAVTLDS